MFLFRHFGKLYDKKVSSTGMSIFRMFYSVILFLEVNQMFRYRELIFDHNPFISKPEFNITFGLLLWLCVIVFLFFGAFTRYVVWANFIFTFIFIAASEAFEYNIHYSYQGVNFLMLFIPVSRNFSIDHILKKLKYSNTRFEYKPKTEIPKIYYYLLLALGVAVLYIDSVLYKTQSQMWMNGLGMWMPSSLPQIAISDNQWLLDQKFLMKALSYLVLVFEAAFIFTFWSKKFRGILAVVGLGLHLGIFIQYPIPYFGLTFVAMLMLMVPLGVWRKIGEKLKSKSPSLTFFYDEECPLCIRTKIVVKSLDVRNKVEFKGVQTHGFNDPRFKAFSQEELLDNIFSIRAKDNKVYQGLDTYREVFKYIPILWIAHLILYVPGFYHLGKYIYSIVAKNRNVERCTEDNCGYEIPKIPSDVDSIKILNNLKVRELKVAFLTFGVVVISCFQLLSTFHSAQFKPLRMSLYEKSPTFYKVDQFLTGTGRRLFGISGHGLFVDGHFRNFNHLINVTYIDENGQKTRLPFVEENGMPGDYIRGINWANYIFRVIGPNINQENLETGLVRYVTFWSFNEGIDMNKGSFVVELKKVETPNDFEWQEGFLTKQMAAPWVEIGTMSSTENVLTIDIPNVESL